MPEDVDIRIRHSPDHTPRETPCPAEVTALSLLLRATPRTTAKVVTQALELVARDRGADQVTVMRRDGDRWVSAGSCSIAGGAGSFLPPPPSLRDFWGPLEAGRVLYINPVSAPPGNPLRIVLDTRSIGAALVVPVHAGGELGGLVMLERNRGDGGLRTDTEALLAAVGDGVLTVMARPSADLPTDQLFATIRAMDERVLLVDDEGRCTRVLSDGTPMEGPSARELPGRMIRDCVPPAVARIYRAAMESAAREGVALAPVHSLGEGAARRWYHLTVARLAEDDDASGYVFRIRDVSDEHARAEENALLSEVTRRMTNLAVVLDGESRVLWVNPAFEALSGWTLEALRGAVLDDRLAGPWTSRTAMARLARGIALRRRLNVELELCNRAGAPIWVEAALQPLAGHETDDRHQLLIMTDISQRKRQEAELRRIADEAASTHQRLRQAIEALDDGFVLYDAEDRLVMCNSRFRAINARIADIILPGVTRKELIRAGLERGMYAPGSDVPEPAATPPGKPAPRVFQGEVRYRDGRVIAARSVRMADGTRVGLRTDITALKRAEERLSDIIRGAGVGTWERDLVTDRLDVNDQWYAMLALNREHVDVADPQVRARLIHPEDGPRVRREIARLRRGEIDQIEIEFRLRHHRGAWIHLLSRGKVTSRDADGRPLRMSGMDIDITARRNAEERLGAILGAALVGTWQFDHDTGDITIDEACARMLGYRLGALAPMSVERFEAMVHPDDIAHLCIEMTAADSADNERFDREFRLRHRDGHWVWILSKARIECWASQGVPLRASGVLIDITENKQREQALADAKAALETALHAREAAEKRLADIAEVADDWFWEEDASHRLTYISSGFERATGIRRDAVLGRRRDQFATPGDKDDAGDWETLRARQDAREAFSDFIYRVGHEADGSPVWIKVSGAPHFDASGGFLGYRGVGTNVSALISATERAEAANRAKSRFLANMSHELRTPLTGVLGIADMLAESVEDPELRIMIDAIRDSGEGLLKILNDVLDLAKIEAGKLQIETQPFLPTELAHRVKMLHSAAAVAKGLRLETRTDPSCDRLLTGDAHRILQILNNLVGNALKFTETGFVRVDLACTATGGLRLAVSDSGIGMSAEQRLRIFDEFEQADGTTARRFGGTGLGLSITRHLVQLMGGTIALDSKPGAGTRIAVTLPLGAPDVQAGPEDEPGAALDFSTVRALVADDNRTNRMILGRMLESMGVQITMTEDGRAAVEAFGRGRFDILLLDISMPLLDGISALTKMRELEARRGTPPVPALAVTANAMAHQVEEYIAAGFAGHVTKPFRKADLEAAIARHARR